MSKIDAMKESFKRQWWCMLNLPDSKLGAVIYPLALSSTLLVAISGVYVGDVLTVLISAPVAAGWVYIAIERAKNHMILWEAFMDQKDLIEDQKRLIERYKRIIEEQKRTNL